ncbi:hypothetical protein GCM10009809_04020 [Isoptericola hypogeus]|uniref:ABC-2 type transport system permease protein n=1 Tax=Isoptericola hypogeus TaxID=300179 RepID=A0ABN2ISI7_9MICO
MAQQLIDCAGGAERPARTGARHESHELFIRLLRTESRRARRSWSSLVGLGIVALPTAQALTQVSSNRLWDNFDLFTLMMSDWLPLLFPLLVTALYLPRFAGELSHGFIRPVRPRTPIGTFLDSRIATAALLAFGVFFVAVAIAALVAFVGNAGHAITPLTPPGAGETPHPVSGRTTFSPLYSISPALYGVAMATWIGANAALWSVVGGLCLLLVGNRFLALAAPTVLFMVLQVAIAYAGFDAFILTGSIFQSNIVQQPAWYPFVQFAGVGLVVALAYAWVRRRRYETSGVE